jgi:hypothetical protein
MDNTSKNNKDNKKGDFEDIEIIIDGEKVEENSKKKKYNTKLADSGGCIAGGPAGIPKA